MMFLLKSYRRAIWLQTEVLEGKRHEHSVTSKINLVDLAGSERQSLAKTSGDRLRVRHREDDVHFMYLFVVVCAC